MEYLERCTMVVKGNICIDSQTTQYYACLVLCHPSGLYLSECTLNCTKKLK